MEYIEIIKEKDIYDLLEIVKVIWEEVFTPIIGESQVKYMLETYQSFENIKEEISDGHKYFILKNIHSVFVRNLKAGFIYNSKVTNLKNAISDFIIKYDISNFKV